MTREELDKRFDHHPPTTPEKAHLHETARQIIKSVGENLNGFLPEGREKALAFTALEEALMWANAAIARSEQP